MAKTEYLDSAHGTRIAYAKTEGAGPTVIFCGGFLSDMTGSKATALEAHCRKRGQAFLRFDYGGHGESSGEFREGAIGGWLQDTLAVIDDLTEGPVVLIGSSMGGWIALLAALARQDRIVALIGIASAADFTDRLLPTRLGEAGLKQMMDQGFIEFPPEPGYEPLVFTQRLLEEGREHLLLGGSIGIDVPVRLLHGMKDPDVPWTLSPEIAALLTSQDVEVILVKEGDHSLSQPRDIARLISVLDGLCATLGESA